MLDFLSREMHRRNKMKKILSIIFIVAIICSCSVFKKIVRTVNDIAFDLCTLTCTHNEGKLGGLSVDEYCSVHENLNPFIESIVAAKKAAAEKAGLENKE
jgi:hypothetical protein